MHLNKKTIALLAGIFGLVVLALAINFRPVENAETSEPGSKASGRQAPALSEAATAPNYERQAKILVENALECLAEDAVSEDKAGEIITAVLDLRVPEPYRDFHLRFYQAISGLADCAGPDKAGNKIIAQKNLADLRAEYEWLD